MDGYNPLGSHYLPSPLAMNQAGTGDEYLNIMAPMPLPDQTQTFAAASYPR